MSSIPNQPSNFSLTARQVSEAKIISVGEKSARVMFGGRKWDISILEKNSPAPKDLKHNADLVQKIADVFQQLVTDGVIDPNKHKTVEIEESKKGSEIEGSVKVFTSQDQSGQVQTITDATKSVLSELGNSLFSNSSSLNVTPASFSPKQKIEYYGTNQKAYLLQQILSTQSSIDPSAKEYDGQFVAFYDKEHTPLTEFLGNFYEIEKRFIYDGKQYKCSEAAYQACKLKHLKKERLESILQDRTGENFKSLKALVPQLENIGANSTSQDSSSRLDSSDTSSYDKAIEALYKAFTNASGEEALKIERCLKELDLYSTSDFIDKRTTYMSNILYEKFSQNPDLKNLLLATKNSYLIEHRYKTAKDTFWSDGGNCTGNNVLGKLLMHVRSELKNDQPHSDFKEEEIDDLIPEFVKKQYAKTTLTPDPFSTETLTDTSFSIPEDSQVKYINGELVHKSVGADGRCADLSLADQLVTKMNIANNDQARSQLAQVLRQDAANYLRSDKWLNEDNIKNAITTSLSEAVKHIQPEATNIKDILKKGTLSKDDYTKLANYYAEYITKNPTAYLDTLFFLALAHYEGTSPSYIQPNIRIVQNTSSQSPDKKPFTEILHVAKNQTPAAPTLTIWFDGIDHYHSYVGSEDLISSSSKA